MTHKAQILHALKQGFEITSMDGLRLGIVRITNRINELRHKGVPIKDRWERTPDGARYKVYWLDKI